MWITLTEDDVLTALTGSEAEAFTTAALDDGQANPLPEIIAQVINHIRARVAACRHNSLGTGDTIPDELKSAAVDIIAYRLATRLPISGRSSIMERLKEKHDDADSLLRDVARCNYAVEQPATVSDEVQGGGSVKVVTSRPRIAKGSDLSGL
jgi:hypothetical protein